MSRTGKVGRAAHRNLDDWVAEFLRAADKDLVRLVVLRRLVTDSHALANGLDRASILFREEVRESVILSPLLAQKVLRTKRRRPVDGLRGGEGELGNAVEERGEEHTVPPPKVAPASTVNPPSSVTISPPSS